MKPVMKVLKKYPTANAAEMRLNRMRSRADLSDAADNPVEFGRKNDSSLFIGANGARVKIANQDMPGNRDHFKVKRRVNPRFSLFCSQTLGWVGPRSGDDLITNGDGHYGDCE